MSQQLTLATTELIASSIINQWVQS